MPVISKNKMLYNLFLKGYIYIYIYIYIYFKNNHFKLRIIFCEKDYHLVPNIIFLINIHKYFIIFYSFYL